MQQRADCKVTFPAYWTNTCCSHPVYDVDAENIEDGKASIHSLLFVPIKKKFDTELLVLGVSLHPEYELEDKDYVGVKRAAKRKLWHELGIKGAALPSLENFHYITRLHYKSLAGSEDGIWGEHEST